MAKKPSRLGIVYSTDPNFKVEEEISEEKAVPVSAQKLRVFLETRHRAGKTMTVISGFLSKQDEIEDLSRKIKVLCGTGGSAKDREILIQGDHREKIMQWLLKNGFPNVKKM